MPDDLGFLATPRPAARAVAVQRLAGPPVPPAHVPAALALLRGEVEASIQRLLDVLDQIDAVDEHRQDDTEDNEVDSRGVARVDDEDGADDEPSLASINPTISGGQVIWAGGCSDDRELGDDNGIADIDGAVEQGWRGMGGHVDG